MPPPGIILLIASSIILAASGSAAAAPPVVVAGSLASLTGSAAEYGTSQARGAALAAVASRGVDNPGVRLVLRDDASSNATATKRMAALVRSGVAAVLGPTLSGVAAAADPVASAAGVPVLAVTNTTLDLPQAGPTVWRVCLSEDRLIPASVRYAHTTTGVTTAALVSVTGDAYSEGAAVAFRAAAAREGVKLVADVTVPTGSTDVAPAIAIAAAGSPKGVFFAARGLDATNLITAATGLNVVRVGGNGFNAPDVIAAAGAAAEGLIVSASWNPGRRDETSRTFVRAYRLRYGKAPDAFAAQGYAGVQVLQAAVTAGRGTTAARVRLGLSRLRTVPSLLGTMRMTRSQEAVYPAVVQRVASGRLVLAG